MVAGAIGDWDHPEAGLGALVATDDDAATVGNGAVQLILVKVTIQLALHMVTMERRECTMLARK